MPPTGLPARETLKLPGRTAIAWAVFDAAWYRAAYPDAGGELGDAEDAAALEFYLETGQRRGHSPNIVFDEAWHRQAYPGLAAQLRDGQAASAFDAYCRAGFRTRSPHWLFDEALYRQRHADLRDGMLASDIAVNGYDHFLRHGSREGRIGHLLFDPEVYLAQLVAGERSEAEAIGGYLHYLRRIARHGPETRVSVYFDPDWYLRRYPEIARAIAGGAWHCALHHYLANDTPVAFDPLPEFAEAYYIERYPDVAAAVDSRGRRNGYDHFLRNGALERRAASDAVDLRYYTSRHATVQSDLDAGRARDPFAHYLTIGRDQGLVGALPPEDRVTERQAGALNRLRAEHLLPVAARMVLEFACAGPPAVSVIMLLRERFALTLMTLGSLRANWPGDIELILLDCGSTDDTERIGRFVHGARMLRYESRPALKAGLDHALMFATADAVLLLDSAMELAPGSLAAALRRLRADPGIGAVCGKLVGAHGGLDSAGIIAWRDGRTQYYLRDASPLAPEANFVRDTDGGSSACLLLRGELLRRLDGYDARFTTVRAADMDLCLRIAEAGARVVYDPAVTVTRLVEVIADADTDDTRQALLERHGGQLGLRRAADRRAEVFARSPTAGPDAAQRVLFVEDTIPLRQLGSGFARSNDLLRVMAALGWHVTVYPINPCRFGLASIYADMPDTVEVMHDRPREDLANFLAARAGYYDTIWIARTHNLDRVRPMLERVIAGADRPPRLVLDTEAVAALREAEHVALTGAAPFDVDAAIRREFANADVCQTIVAVTSAEAARLRDLGLGDVTVIGHWREVAPTPRPFIERAGMLFLGAMHRQDSPNRDALAWFVREVLPLVEQSLGWETRLTVAGYVGQGVSLDDYRDHPRITLRGAVDNVVPLYDSHRLFVAPARFAAGVPYKVHEAASYGLPVVASELLRRQLGWTHGRDMLAADTADPKAFAQLVVTLYRDAALWQSLRDNALERLRTENGNAQYAAAVRQVLDGGRSVADG